MHERGLVSKAAAELASRIGDRQVDSITLSIGPDTQREVVEDAWRSATAGTPIADTPIEWVSGAHELVCLDCGASYRGRKLTPCARCGGNGLIVEAAPEVVVMDAGEGVR
jgi:Zn finger protein HypA/HybF involved in hydrogenase expression